MQRVIDALHLEYEVAEAAGVENDDQEHARSALPSHTPAGSNQHCDRDGYHQNSNPILDIVTPANDD